MDSNYTSSINNTPDTTGRSIGSNHTTPTTSMCTTTKGSTPTTNPSMGGNTPTKGDPNHPASNFNSNIATTISYTIATSGSYKL